MDRILTTHVGSMMRPQNLLALQKEKRAAYVADEPYERLDEYERVLRESVHDIVRKQVQAGVDIVTDGEFGKSINWGAYIQERVGGFEIKPFGPGGPPMITDADRAEFSAFYAQYDREMMGDAFDDLFRGAWTCIGPVAYTGQADISRDIANLTSAVQAAGAYDAFLPVVAPGSAAFVAVNEHYSDDREMLFAVARALNDEYRAVVDAGLIVQLDDAVMAHMKYVMIPPASFDDYLAWARLQVDALKVSLEGIPPERSRYHLCHGSWNGPHTHDVYLPDIIDLILEIPVGGYSIEMANPRHEYEWHLWETHELPENRVLIPGVISHATNIVEHPLLVAERITRLASLLGRDRVIASTDCGFSQAPTVVRVHETIMWAKLRALSEGARLATDALWA